MKHQKLKPYRRTHAKNESIKSKVIRWRQHLRSLGGGNTIETEGIEKPERARIFWSRQIKMKTPEKTHHSKNTERGIIRAQNEMRKIPDSDGDSSDSNDDGNNSDGDGDGSCSEGADAGQERESENEEGMN